MLFVYVPTPEWRAFPTLRRYCEESEVEFVDLTFDPPASAAQLFFPVDRHFNPAGHAHAAKRILARIEQRGWLASRTDDQR